MRDDKYLKSSFSQTPNLWISGGALEHVFEEYSELYCNMCTCYTSDESTVIKQRS